VINFEQTVRYFIGLLKHLPKIMKLLFTMRFINKKKQKPLSKFLLSLSCF